jgi:hypothetical protein
MKTIKNLLCILSIGISLNIQTTLAGSESHGGDGVIVGNKIYLLDLYEAGIEESPSINPLFPGTEATIQRLEAVFSDFDVPVEILASKIAEVESLDFQFGRSMLLAIEKINWNLVSGELVEVADENSSIDLKKSNHIQLAIRSGQDVLINRQKWQRLALPHRAALILHEALFALIKVDSEVIATKVDGQKTSVTRYYQDSRKARSVNGYLFKKALQSNKKEGLYSKLSDNFEFGFSLNPTEVEKGFIRNSPVLKLEFKFSDLEEDDDDRDHSTWHQYDWGTVITLTSPRDEVGEQIINLCKGYSGADSLSWAAADLKQDIKSVGWDSYSEFGDSGAQMYRLTFVTSSEIIGSEHLNKDKTYAKHPEVCIAEVSAKVDEYFKRWKK